MDQNDSVSEFGDNEWFCWRRAFAAIYFAGPQKRNGPWNPVSLSLSRHESYGTEAFSPAKTEKLLSESFLAARPGLSGKALLGFEVGRC